MHFIQNLLNYMCPPFNFIFAREEPIPPGFDLVITNTGAYVVTVRNNNVIAVA